jgi:hypothetical protein
MFLSCRFLTLRRTWKLLEAEYVQPPRLSTGWAQWGAVGRSVAQCGGVWRMGFDPLRPSLTRFDPL